MKKIVLLLVFMTALSGNAQDEPAHYQEVRSAFVKLYNQKDHQQIFTMFSKEMKQAVPLEKIKEVVTTFHQNLGRIDSLSLQGDQGFVKLYKASFEITPMTMQLSVNKDKQITGLLFKAWKDPNATTVVERNKTPLSLPFKGKWFIVWGGDTVLQNYHVEHKPQQRAFDIVILDDNKKSYKGEGTTNEDYYAFGQPLYAACNATVVKMQDGIEDNVPGVMNAQQPSGNMVMLKTEQDEYILYAHFKKGTVAVKEGDIVKTGDYLGDCGNSGNSSEAHLHFHMQDSPDRYNANGIKCYFEEFLVNGKIKKDYSPVRLETIQPIEE